MQQRGVTLIELIVTLAVLGLLALAAMPSISDWLRNARMRNMTESIQTGMQQARNEAVRRNRQVSFWLVNLPSPGVMDNNCTLSNGSNANGWVVSVDSPNARCGAVNSLSTSPMIVARGVLTQGANGVGVSGSNSGSGVAASSVTFDGLGRVVTSATSPARNLTRLIVAYGAASDTDRPLQIDIDPAGGMRRCDKSITDSSDSRACPGSSDETSETDGG